MRLSIVEIKVRNVKGEVKPWVEKRISDEIIKMQARFDGFE